MSGNQRASNEWSSVQAYTLAVVCLLIGVTAGWLFRGSQSPSAGSVVENASAASSSMGASANGQPTPEQMKKMADLQAAPLIERLKSDPNNADLLAKVGNIYYDTQQYPVAIDYYHRSLQVQPANASVRTDMATGIWYSGDADTAIKEFNKALSYEPTNANTLFNLGVVEWQGKMDVKGALAAWQKLLDTNPNYEAKEKVYQLMAEAKKHSTMKPGSKAKPLPE
jgi:cytochrome c-type biogenesis protein CcmH/NrfG